MKKLSMYSAFIAACCSVFLQLVIPTYAADASLSLSPTSKNVTVGEKFDAAVILNTGGTQTAATDVIITFDSNKLVLLDITNGTTFDQYIGKSINNISGSAALSGFVSSADVLFSGTGTFATLKFQATSAGTAAVSFDFTAGNRNDSNVAEYNSSTDILTSVANGSYTVTGTGTYTPPTATPVPASSSTNGGSSTSTGSTSTTTTTTTTTNRARTTQQLPVTASPLPGVLVTFAGIALIWFGMLTGKNV